MANYFSNEQIEKIQTFLSMRREIPEGELEYITKYILGHLKPEDIVAKDGVLIICKDGHYGLYNYYGKKECAIVEECLKNELKARLGLDVEVSLECAYTTEVEPDPLPPMYFGGTDTVYHYHLNITAKL